MINLLKIMVTIVVFDEFLINWVYPDNPIYRFTSQLLIYIILLIIVIRFNKNDNFTKSSLNNIFIIFFIIVLISNIFNDGVVFYKIANINSFLKYSPLIFVLSNRKISEIEINNLIHFIFYLGIITVIINSIQFIFPTTISLFLPKQSVVEIGMLTKEFNYKDAITRDGLVGVFGHSPTNALFLVIILAIYLFNIQNRIKSNILRNKIIKISFVFLLLLLIAQSFSTISLIIAVILIISYLIRYTNLLKNPFVLVIFLLVLIMSTNFLGKVGEIADLEKIISAEYYENSLRNSRLWLIAEVPTTIIDNAEFFGYGTDMENVKKEISKNNPSTGRKIIAYSAFEDIYWVAILAYYGILGLIVFIIFNYKAIYFIKNYVDNRNLKDVYLSVLFIILFGSLLVATFEFRVISFFYWFIISISLSTSKSQTSTKCSY